MKRKPLLVAFAVVLLACIVAMAVFVSQVNSTFGLISPPLSFRLADYQSIITDVNAGAITPDASGTCQLPPKFEGVTPRDEIYVGTTPTGSVVILFPTWHGRDPDVDGYIHASAPLVPADYYIVNWGVVGNLQCIDVGKIDMLTPSLVRGAWYWGSRRLE